MTEKGLLVIDASMAIDLFAGKDAGRVRSAERVFECVSSKGINVYAPRLFVVEVAGVLVRFLDPSATRKVVERLLSEITLSGDNLYFEISIETALKTGSRGADAYYIGLAKILDAPLATSDRVQSQNARKVGIKSFYILNTKELENLIELLDCGK